MENKWGPYYIPFHNNRRNKKTYIFFCYKSYEFLGQSSCDRYRTVALTKTLSFLGRCLVTHKYIRFIKCTSWLAYFILLRIARISKFDKDIYIYINKYNVITIFSILHPVYLIFIFGMIMCMYIWFM